MKSNVKCRRWAPLILATCVWLIWPAHGLARSEVRFLHGVPGVGATVVSIDDGTGERTVGTIGFAQSTAWRSVRSGRFRWTLKGGGRTLAAGTATVGNGAYDIVALERRMKVWLGIYKARGATSGKSLVRVIHGAPELGSPELTVDGRPAVRRLAYRQATPYVTLAPGSHSLGAVRPTDHTAVIAGVRVTVKPDTAYSAVVLGTRGERVRVVSLVDRGAPPARARRHPAPHGHRRADPAGARHPGIVVVRPGDSLWAIARRLAGPGASDAAVERKLVAIWDRNQARIGTGDPNLIFPGTSLRLP